MKRDDNLFLELLGHLAAYAEAVSERKDWSGQVVHNFDHPEIAGFHKFLSGAFAFLERQRRLVVVPEFVRLRNPDEPEADYIKRTWEYFAEDWLTERTFALQILNADYLLNEFRLFGGVQRVLSMGAGYGIVEAFLAKLHATEEHRLSFDLVDCSERMCELSGKLAAAVRLNGGGFSQKPLSNITVKRADIAALPFADHSFDHIFCLSSLHWMRDWKQTLREAARVIRPNNPGRMYLVWPEGRKPPRDREDGDCFDLYVEDVLDELEANRFVIEQVATSILAEGDGVAYLKFVRCRFQESGTLFSWRRSGYANRILNSDSSE